jgi:hypothetical protein
MTDQRKSYSDYVREDLHAIEARAMTLYALSRHDEPWPSAFHHIQEKFLRRAARELWQEGALHLDPSLPYFEGADQ